MGKDRSPESKVHSLKSAGGNAIRPGEATQSHLQATCKPSAWEGIATLMRPSCDLHAILKPPSSHPQATPMRPRGEGRGPMPNEERQMADGRS
jgi:hypothetical protein